MRKRDMLLCANNSVAGGGVWPSALRDSLVAFWALDEASGTRADSIGSNTLTDNNTVGSDTGLVYPLAADFVADNDERLSASMDASLQPGSTDFWVSAWVRPTALSSFQTIIAARDGGAVEAIDYILRFNSTSPEFLINIGGTLYTATVSETAALDTWVFVIGWRDGNDVYCQIDDNAPATTSAVGGSVATNTAELSIGAYGSTSSEALDGRIGPAMIGTGHVPTAQDRAFLYNGGNGRKL